MRRSLARFSRQEASNRIPTLVDFITITPGFRLSVHTVVGRVTSIAPALRRRSIFFEIPFWERKLRNEKSIYRVKGEVKIRDRTACNSNPVPNSSPPTDRCATWEMTILLRSHLAGSLAYVGVPDLQSSPGIASAKNKSSVSNQCLTCDVARGVRDKENSQFGDLLGRAPTPERHASQPTIPFIVRFRGFDCHSRQGSTWRQTNHAHVVRPPVCTENSNPDVMMVKPSED